MTIPVRSYAVNSFVTRPISPAEFLAQIWKVWSPTKASGQRSQPKKIGLCVSGGPDSMALASLFQQLRRHETGPSLDLKALVIDHAHRANSQKEAERVSNNLRNLGIQSRIIPLQWPEDRDFALHGDFETVARILRYRSLAHACVEEEIRHLFLGHHLSDQAETILFRLMRGCSASLKGLIGMMYVNKIPHSGDIFGASDGLDAASLSKLLVPTSMYPSATNDHRITQGEILISCSGIKICRPLLRFPKSRLIATCEANRVPFVVDQSNFDATMTTRNAIRWLLANDKLPTALREDSILRLGAAAARSEERRKDKVVQILTATRLETFDLRSGRVVVHIPNHIILGHDVTENDAISYVDHLLRLVCPESERSRSVDDLVTVARWMFPSLRDALPCRLDMALEVSSCTARNTAINRRPGCPATGWELSRQPLRAGENLNIAFADFIDSNQPNDTDTRWSRWVRWDGRFWIRIWTHDPKDVRRFQIRALNQSDMAGLKGLSGGQRISELRKILKEAAPGKTRYTIPVLIKDNCVCALPTCNIRWPCAGTDRFGATVDTAGQLRWEVRYKDVTGVLQHFGNPRTL